MHTIVDSKGLYIAQLCHIEAALEGGPRFNRDQTDEDRRSFENLLLLCYRHHKETDDVIRFSVEKMREIKRQHESKFDRVLDALANDVYDIALSYEPTVPNSLDRLVALNLIPGSELDVYARELESLAQTLNQLSPAARKTYLILIKRVDSNSLRFPIGEFLSIASTSRDETHRNVKTLERYGLVYDDENSDDFERSLVVQPAVSESPYPMALVLRDYCNIEAASLHTMLVDLDFQALAANV